MYRYKIHTYIFVPYTCMISPNGDMKYATCDIMASALHGK